MARPRVATLGHNCAKRCSFNFAVGLVALETGVVIDTGEGVGVTGTPTSGMTNCAPTARRSGLPMWLAATIRANRAASP